MPSHDGKKLCMRFISNQGCRGKGNAYVFPHRGHFYPPRLPAPIKASIKANFGGLKLSSKPIALLKEKS